MVGSNKKRIIKNKTCARVCVCFNIRLILNFFFFLSLSLLYVIMRVFEQFVHIPIKCTCCRCFIVISKQKKICLRCSFCFFFLFVFVFLNSLFCTHILANLKNSIFSKSCAAVGIPNFFSDYLSSSCTITRRICFSFSSVSYTQICVQQSRAIRCPFV